MKKATLYEVRGHYDTSEGRGGTYLIGFFKSLSTATEAAKNKGVWGQPGPIEHIEGYIINYPDGGQECFIRESDVHLIQTETKEDIAKRAKEKLASLNLTPDELAALGLKD